MITHCYFYRLRNGASVEDAMQELLSMKEQIPEIDSIEVGINFSTAPNAFDLVQLSKFESYEDFKAFAEHPYHQELRDYFATVSTETAKVDFESC